MQHSLPFIVPIVAMLGSFLLVAVLRYMRHQERMNMIEKGISPADLVESDARPFNPNRSPYLLIGAGAGLLTAIFLTKGMGAWLSDDEGTGIYFACIGIGAGLGILLANRRSNSGQ